VQEIAGRAERDRKTCGAARPPGYRLRTIPLTAAE